MNANELADGLSKNQIYGDDYGLFNKRIQNMLRQQQAEIEALKQSKFDANNKVNNEPVAWLLFRDGGESYPEYTTSYKQMREWETYLGDNERIEPHYTHPAKTLTDEEILNSLQEAIECAESASNGGGVDWYAYAEQWKAILRKAQEK